MTLTIKNGLVYYSPILKCIMCWKTKQSRDKMCQACGTRKFKIVDSGRMEIKPH